MPLPAWIVSAVNARRPFPDRIVEWLGSIPRPIVHSDRTIRESEAYGGREWFVRDRFEPSVRSGVLVTEDAPNPALALNKRDAVFVFNPSRSPTHGTTTKERLRVLPETVKVPVRDENGRETFDPTFIINAIRFSVFWREGAGYIRIRPGQWRADPKTNPNPAPDPRFRIMAGYEAPLPYSVSINGHTLGLVAVGCYVSARGAPRGVESVKV